MSRTHGPRGPAHHPLDHGQGADGTHAPLQQDPFAQAQPRQSGHAQPAYPAQTGYPEHPQSADRQDYAAAQAAAGQAYPAHGHAHHPSQPAAAAQSWPGEQTADPAAYDAYREGGHPGYTDPGYTRADPAAWPDAAHPQAENPYGEAVHAGAHPHDTAWPHHQTGQSSPAEAAYAPQFAPFDPLAQHGAQQAAQPAYANTHAAEPQLRGASYDDHYSAHPSQQPAHTPDPFGAEPAAAHAPYDAASYPGQQAAYADAAAYQPAPQPAPGGHYDGYGGGAEPGFAPAASQQQAGAQLGLGTSATSDSFALDNRGFQQDPGLRDAPVPADQTALDPGYDDDEDDDYEVPERSTSSRMMMIAGALVGAIAVGGGLAYAYKTFLGGPDTQIAGAPPVVRSQSGPSKVRPDDPGGRQFAHTDSKIMDRLGGGGAGATAATGASLSAGASPAQRDANGTRRVSTITIGRDGTVRTPSAAPTPPASTAPANPAVSFPGLTVVGPLGGTTSPVAAQQRRQPTRNALSPERPARPLVVSPPAGSAPAKPVVIANARASTTRTDAPSSLGGAFPATSQTGISSDGAIARIINPITGRPVAVVAPDRKGVVPAEALNRVAVSNISPSAAAAVTATRSAPRTTAATPRASSSGLGGSPGYVVVLASVPKSSSSRMEALARFADIQQTYSSVLSGKAPDVREANLGARGKYDRLMVGPPGSRDNAATLCSSLKKAGYSGCWVMAY